MKQTLFGKQNVRIMFFTLALVIIPLFIISLLTTLKLKDSIEEQNILTMKNSISERLTFMQSTVEFAIRECTEIAHNPLSLQLITASNALSSINRTEIQDIPENSLALEKSLDNYLNRIVSDSELYESIFLLDKNGTYVTDALNGIYKDFNFKELDLYDVSIHGSTYIQDVMESPYTHKPIMIVSNPVFGSDNEIVGIVGTVIDFDKLTDPVVRESNLSCLNYGIVNSKGLLIAHSDKNLMFKVNINEENSSLKAIFEKMQCSTMGQGFYEFEGIKKVMIFTDFTEKDWHMFCSVSVSVYMKSINDVKTMIIWIVILCIIIACLIILRTSQLKVSNNKLKDALIELKEAQSQLIISEKMAALGGLVAGIAHEINTPVGVGVTAVSHLKKKTDQFYELYKNNQIKRSDLETLINTSKEAADMIYSNLLRASSLIQSFKRIAVDQSSEEKREFNLRNYIDEIILSLKPVLKNTKHRIHVECTNNLIINSYPGAFSQIINNFILNSLRHGYDSEDVEGNIKINISTYSTMIILKYSDDGKGMESNILEKIFDPFFTTKRGKGGTGMGLNVVYNIVTKELNGTIKCKSEPGKGTEFTIIFPIDNDNIN